MWLKPMTSWKEASDMTRYGVFLKQKANPDRLAYPNVCHFL
ncbi:MAG: hypothetical protein N2747_00295 [Chitinophagaceae bacterium]|nr:hypothetical protein [Chitinophagaceae bacterium]